MMDSLSRTGNALLASIWCALNALNFKWLFLAAVYFRVWLPICLIDESFQDYNSWIQDFEADIPKERLKKARLGRLYTAQNI